MVADNSQQQAHIPKHVAIIMDGNGRWAQMRGKPRAFGHKAGVDAVRQAVKFAANYGIKALTLYAFSSENWRRPEAEVSMLMELFITVLGREAKRLHKNNVKLNIIGDIEQFSPRLQQKIEHAEQITANNDGLQLNIAANYGGRWDVVNAAKELARQVQNGQLMVNDIDEVLFHQYTCLSELPAPDLLIRTGGDQRISNFLIWQAAYTEFYFSQTLWPDFDDDAFLQAVSCFSSRERRFGQTGEQVREIPLQTNMDQEA